ncbi:carbonic anhydrase family protein [Temperatibacter marinus]|uniref:carbonic anhydrase n=1 Tax=Temperatibacter marinus TaxID=1456591 RepID=A0AA52EFN3_9PROT|nr:carbonic anhydrase family protein [Temperatibacter marinus]WND03916.1 carbonic anhydrase family protein [Temperatibacter marinus]
MIKPILATAVLAVSMASTATTQDINYQNPQSWGGTCKTGKSQSPIDINGTEAAHTYALQLHYNVTALDLVNTGSGLQQTYQAGSMMKVGMKSYELKHINFHTPSEHTIMGKKFPAALHFVHTDQSGNVAIIGAMVETGTENAAAKELLASLPANKGDSRKNARTQINARDLMPHNKSYYRYMGSLTTPPCSEGVNWYLLKTPIQMSAGQLQALEGVMKMNARPVQSRNYRLIVDTNSQ